MGWKQRTGHGLVTEVRILTTLYKALAEWVLSQAMLQYTNPTEVGG